MQDRKRAHPGMKKPTFLTHPHYLRAWNRLYFSIDRFQQTKPQVGLSQLQIILFSKNICLQKMVMKCLPLVKNPKTFTLSITDFRFDTSSALQQCFAFLASSVPKNCNITLIKNFRVNGINVCDLPTTWFHKL